MSRSKLGFLRLVTVGATLLFGAWLLVAPLVSAATPIVLVLTAKGAVTPVMASYFSRGISLAEQKNAMAVVIQLDTPGGLDTAMRDIVQRINGARVPVVVYVSPAGARAASAGAFITMAAHVAVMAPNTAIGAAHPVAGNGQQIEGPMEDKVVNDAVAYIRGIAKLRGRSEDWAERAVRQSISTQADEAVKEHVVDFVATDLPSLLKQLDGRKAKLLTSDVEIVTIGATVELLDMNFVEAFLFAISDPNIAYILLSIAMLGIFLELSNPGAILPGIVGGISLVMALFSLGMLPVNIAGLLLIGLGFLLFLAEVWVTAHGLLSVGGVLSLALGSFLLTSGAAPELQINRWLITGVVGMFSLFAFFIVGAIVRSRRAAETTGLNALVGMQGVARSALELDGTVFVHGELWSAHSDDGAIQPGERVRVTAMEGLQLHVTKVTDS